MSQQSLAQRRAKHALDEINGLKEKQYGNYISYVKSLGPTVIMNGLGQAAATLRASAKGKNDDPHEILYQHLSRWLCGGDEDSPYLQGDLLEKITTTDENCYLRAQAEALAYLEWLKKFANAFLEKGGQTNASAASAL